MDDLATWLRAQLDEDERVVRRNTDGRGLDGGYPQYPTFVDDDTAAADAYLAQFGSARVLREVEAKRRRLERHQPRISDDIAENMGYGPAGVAYSCYYCEETGDQAWPCRELRLDLAVYADRPGYRDEWRP